MKVVEEVKRKDVAINNVAGACACACVRVRVCVCVGVCARTCASVFSLS